jgi:hypothetical protein
MEGIDEKKNNDSNLDPKEDLEITKKFLIEVIGESDTNSTVELSDYEQALDLFEQGSKEGKNIILYEVHKSKIDESVVKKVPVLNSSTYAARIRAPQEKLKEANPSRDASISASFSKSSSPDKKENLTLAMKNKIIILAAVVAGYLKRVLPGEPEANVLVSTRSSPDKKDKATLKTMKNKIIILAAVVAGLMILLFIFEILAAGASRNMSGHLIAFDAGQNYDIQSTTIIDYTRNHKDLF